ncbi:MAG: spore maturation protein A [Clostridia bacterium]|nr:spore maturation protein A [Clostridia bacterium]
MLGYIWFFMIIVSIVCSVVTGRTDTLTSSVTEGADKAVRLLISMAGVMCLWTGMMKIADKSGATKIISKMLSPILRFLMPDLQPESPAMQAVSANITANILGLGNAATPLGIKAMQEMQRSSRLKDRPDPSMIMFVVINTASVQLIPATAAALRQAAGSSDPYSILPFVWMTSAAALIVGIILTKLCSSARRYKIG